MLTPQVRWTAYSHVPRPCFSPPTWPGYEVTWENTTPGDRAFLHAYWAVSRLVPRPNNQGSAASALTTKLWLWGNLVSCSDPSPEKGLVFWATFLVTWGGVEWHKECNYCIPRARASHCRHTRSRARWHPAIWFELSDQGAVTRKVVQNTRPSFSHVQGGAGHETRANYQHFTCSLVPMSPVFITIASEGLGTSL